METAEIVEQNQWQGMVILASSQATQNRTAYEKEKLSTSKDVHRQGRADLKWAPNADVRYNPYNTLSGYSHQQGFLGQVKLSLPCPTASQELSSSRPTEPFVPMSSTDGFKSKKHSLPLELQFNLYSHLLQLQPFLMGNWHPGVSKPIGNCFQVRFSKCWQPNILMC